MLVSKLPNGSLSIAARVCDNLNTCATAKTTATVTPLDSNQIVEIGRNLDKHINL